MNFHVEPMELVEVWNGIDANEGRETAPLTIVRSLIVRINTPYIVTQRKLTLLLEPGSS